MRRLFFCPAAFARRGRPYPSPPRGGARCALDRVRRPSPATLQRNGLRTPLLFLSASDARKRNEAAFKPRSFSESPRRVGATMKPPSSVRVFLSASPRPSRKEAAFNRRLISVGDRRPRLQRRPLNAPRRSLVATRGPSNDEQSTTGRPANERRNTPAIDGERKPPVGRTTREPSPAVLAAAKVEAR